MRNNDGWAHGLAMATFSLSVLTLTTACAQSEPSVRGFSPIGVTVTADGSQPVSAAGFIQGDLTAVDRDHRLRWGEAPEIKLHLAVAPPVTVAGAYRLRSQGDVVVVEAGDVLGWQYGAYDALERAGIVWIHPEELLVAESPCSACLADLDVTAIPAFAMRGTHIHTLHPLEYESTLLGSDPVHLDRFRHLAGWLVARRQNYLEWNLLRTVNLPAWIEHAKKIVHIGHERGLHMGIVAPLAFRQQNSFTLIDPDSDEPITIQTRRSVDWLMQAGWDRIHVEMGASEFFPVSDAQQVASLSDLAAYLDERWGVKTATKVHCTINQTAPSYGDMNFNYIAQFADPRLGVMPHTVQFYDLYRPAPTYDREDFSDLREFLLSQIGKRPVYYYPETAYWVTFDIDIPIFLPQYIYSRWNDLYRLRGSGMDGQINFSSGFEWGYWLNDWAAAWYAWEPTHDYTAPLARILAPFGAAATAALDTLDRVIRWQGDALLVGNGIRWMGSWEAADDVGHFAGIHAQPVAVRLYEIADMDAAELARFVGDEQPSIEALIEPQRRWAAAWRALDSQVSPPARRTFEEIAVGLEMNAVRAEYFAALVRAVVARREGELALRTDSEVATAAAFADADEALERATELVRQQETRYRFPHAEIAVERESLTSYPFGYLRTVTDLYYWQRERRMADDPRGFDFLESIYDMRAASGF